MRLPLLLALSAGAHAQCPSHWLPGNVDAGLTPTATAFANWDPDGPGAQSELLVVAGDFFEAGGERTARIAAWDGSGWRPLGPGFPLDSGWSHVTTLTTYQGQLIAGGGDEASARVARFNGAAWIDFSPPIGPVRELCSHNGALYALSYTAAASWNGEQWQTFATPSAMECLASYSGDLIAGGINYWTAPVVWRLQGTTWTPMSNGLESPFQSYGVADLLVHQGELFALGDIAVAADGYGLARWNGSTWLPVQTPNYAQFSYPYRMTSVGSQIAMTSAGSSQSYTVHMGSEGNWQLISQPLQLRWLPVVGTYTGSLVVGGNFSTCDGSPANSVASWDAGQWRPLGAGVRLGYPPSATPYAAPVVFGAILHNEDLLLFGDFSQIRSSCVAGIARLSASGVVDLFPPSPLNAVRHAAKCSDRVIVAGRMLSGWAVAEFASGVWTQLGPPTSDILSLVCHQGTAVRLRHGNTIERWTGLTWVPLPPPAAGIVADRLSEADGQLYVLGYQQGAQPGRLFLLSNGSWKQVGPALPFVPSAITWVNGEAVVGGRQWGAAPAYVVRLRQGIWQPLGSSVWSPHQPSGPVRIESLASHPGVGLLAAGSFRMIGTETVNSLARWNGANWVSLHEPLGTYNPATSPYVHATAVLDRQLVVVGAFDKAGEQPSPLFARLDVATASCYANCDCSTTVPMLNAQDFSCFLQRFAAGDPYANCDGSAAAPALNVADFSCFLQRFAQGCN